MTVNLQHYRDMLEQPWGKIMYHSIFAQLGDIKGKEILDFGAGFGITASHLAQHNKVTAIEPNADLLYANDTAPYTKILGSIDALRTLPSQTFDLIICHNVLEYIPTEEHATYLAEFERLLKQNGQLSLIKHNTIGKVIHEVVFNNDTKTAKELLNGQDNYKSAAFTTGHSYRLEDLAQKTNLSIKHYRGIRMLYALQPNEVKAEEGWLERLLDIEMTICEQSPYKDMAFFHHVTLEK